MFQSIIYAHTSNFDTRGEKNQQIYLRRFMKASCVVDITQSHARLSLISQGKESLCTYTLLDAAGIRRMTDI